MWIALLLLAAPEPYVKARAALEEQRTAFAAELKEAKTKKEKRAVLDRASGVVLHAIVNDLLPAWTGTLWAFQGTSDIPGVGEIACGMFVGTILEHAGFNLDRIALGRLASEKIALTLTGEKNVRRYRLVPAETVEKELSEWGEGLYLVGLDHHAAFVTVDAEGRVLMVHSSYYAPSRVRAEPVTGLTPFADSKYRVIAKLLDRQMTRRWVLSTPFLR